MLRVHFDKNLAELAKKAVFATPSSAHYRAWVWAMSMTYAERQQALKILTAKAVTRDRWHELRDTPIAPVDSDVWYCQLNPKADPKVG